MRGLFQKLVPLKVDLADCVEFGFIALIRELCRLATEILDLKYRAKSSTARIGYVVYSESNRDPIYAATLSTRSVRRAGGFVQAGDVIQPPRRSEFMGRGGSRKLNGVGPVPVETVHEGLGQTPHQQEQDYEAIREIPAGTVPA